MQLIYRCFHYVDKLNPKENAIYMFDVPVRLLLRILCKSKMILILILW